MSAPSREFMIRQAVLNATSALFPNLTKMRGAAHVLDQTTFGGAGVGSLLSSAVRDEYHALASRYQVAA